MFRLSFKLFAIGLLLVGLVPRLAFAEIKQERLGADGFPADWKAGDFAIGKEIISKTTPAAMAPSLVNASTTLSVRGAVNSSASVPASGVGGGSSATLVMPQADARGVERIGVLKLGTGGEAPDVWQKAGRADAETGLERAVAQGVASPAMKEAWRRLLLSEADAPVVADKGMRASWLAVRGNTLEKLGLHEAAWGLWREVPVAALGDDSLAEGWVEAKLLAGQAQEACAMAKTKAANNAGAGNWPAVMAVCQLVGNGANQAAASLSLQVVEPVLRAKNPPLLRILSAVQDGKVVTNLGGPMAQVDSLGGAVLAAYPALVGPEVMPRMPDVALRRLVASDALPLDLRGRAAIALARQTGLPQDGAVAWNLVSSTSFTGALPDAMIVARGMVGISGSEIGLYVQAALRLGMVEKAAGVIPAWEKLVGLNANEARVRVQSQLAVAALQGKVEDRLWDTWLLAQPLEVQSGVRQAQRTLLVIEGLGVGVPARVWAQMRDRAVPVSTLVDPAWQRLLAGDVHDENLPGALGLISEAWVGQPPAGVVPVVMGASIEALRRMGMEDIARRVAAEAMLGIPASHLIPLVQEAPVAVSETQAPVIGADAVSATAPVANDAVVLPPPRVVAPKKPVIKAPSKPTVPSIKPKVGG